MIHDTPLKILSDDDASRVVIDRYDTAKKRRDERKPLYLDWYATYRSHMDVKKAKPFRSKLFIPTAFSHIESHLPRLAAARPRIEIWGRGPEDARRAAAQRALAFFYWDHLRMDVGLVSYAKSALIYSTSWWKVGWKRKVRTRRRRVTKDVSILGFFGNTVGMQKQTTWEEVETREYDAPTVDLMEPENVLYDPDGYDEDSAGYIIEVSVENLLDLQEAIKPDGTALYDKEVLTELARRAKEGSNQVDVIDTGASERRRTFNRVDRRDGENQDPFKRQWTVITEWTDDTVRAVIKEDPSLPPIRNERNDLGMKPFVRYTPIPLPNEMEGISMVETLTAIVDSQNRLINARHDHIMQTVHAMYTIRQASGLQPSQIHFRPSGAISVVDHDDIAPLQTPRLDFTHYRESDFLRQLAQEVSGSTDIYRGVGGSGGDTATEASILSQAAASRVGLMFQILSAQSLYRLGKLWIRYSELYLDRERQLRILGTEFDDQQQQQTDPQTGQPVEGQQPQTMVVTPEDLSVGSDEDLDLIIDVSQTEPGTRQFKLQRAQQLLQTVGGVVAPGGPVYNRILRNALEGLGDDNPDKILDEERAYIQQLQQQQQQQAAGAGQSDAQNLAINASADAGGGP